jgi:hypothetical protein
MPGGALSQHAWPGRKTDHNILKKINNCRTQPSMVIPPQSAKRAFMLQMQIQLFG